MAEAKKINSGNWQETYRDKIGQMRDWLLTPCAHYIQWGIVVFMVFTIVLLGMVTWKYSLQINNKDVEFDILLKNSIENCTWINVFLTIGLIMMTLLSSIYVTLRRPRWYHLPLYPILPMFMLTIPQWYSIQTAFPSFNYPILITICLGFLFVVEAIILTLNFITREKLNALQEGNHGFVVKTTSSKMVETGWDEYIKTIFELIGKSQLAEESFAIGIAGSWGSGKTTFYDAIKSEIESRKQFLLCEFKPWQILESEQLSSEFFTVFAKAISNNSDTGKQLRKSIRKYVQLLTKVPKIADFAKSIDAYLNLYQEETIQELRSRINKQLEKGNTTIAVLIDDLDRLNKNELLEIMRLVRSSANFKHVLFILTYDKGYFENILDKEQGIEFLKKIVNVEICLPSVEQYKYGRLLYQSVANVCKDAFDSVDQNKQAEKILSDLDQLIQDENEKVEESVLYEHLHNFRDIKRFANSLGLAIRHLIKNNEMFTLDFKDLFWLEILHYVDEEIYDLLRTNHNILLEFKTSRIVKQRILTLQNNPKIKLNIRGDNDLKERKSYSLLVKLFAPTNEYKPGNSIVRINNYYSFFSYRLVDHYVSTTEFVTIIHTYNSDRIWEKVKGWLKNSYNKNGVEEMLKDYPLNGRFDNEKVAANYIYILVNLFLMKKPYDMEEFALEHVKAKFNRKSFNRIPSYNPMNIIKRLIVENPGIQWNKFLTLMCPSEDITLAEFHDEAMQNANKEGMYVLSPKQLKELAIINYSKLYSRKKMTILELFSRKNEQMNFIMTLSYPSKTRGLNKEVAAYDNLLSEYILKQFSKERAKKYKKEIFINIYQNLVAYSKAKGVEDEDRALSLVHDTIEQMFGPIKRFESFVADNFELDEECVLLCKHIGLDIKANDVKKRRIIARVKAKKVKNVNTEDYISK